METGLAYHQNQASCSEIQKRLLRTASSTELIKELTTDKKDESPAVIGTMGAKATPEQERLKSLLSETVVLLCKNGLQFKKYVKIQGLLGITLDEEDIFLVQLNEVLGEIKETEKNLNERTNPVKPSKSKACGCKRKNNTKVLPGAESEKPVKKTRQSAINNTSSSAEDPLPRVMESLSRQVITENPKRNESSEKSSASGGKFRAEIDLTKDEETKKEEVSNEDDDVKIEEPATVPPAESKVMEATPQDSVVLNNNVDPIYYQTVQPQMQSIDPMMLGYGPNTLYTTAVSQPREIVPMTNTLQSMAAQYAQPAQYAQSVGNPYIMPVMRNIHHGDNATLIQDSQTGAVIQVSQNQEVLAATETLPRFTAAVNMTEVSTCNTTPDVQVIETTPVQEQSNQSQSMICRPASTPFGNPFLDNSPMKLGGFGFSFGAPEKIVLGKNYTCAVCGMKFSQENNMLWHQRMHDVDKLGSDTYRCGICGNKFESMDLLAEHTQQQHESHNKARKKKKHPMYLRHSDYKPDARECPNCGICFSEHSQLLQHQCVFDAKECQCTVCGKSFRKTRRLARHIRNRHPAAEYQAYLKQLEEMKRTNNAN